MFRGQKFQISSFANWMEVVGSSPDTSFLCSSALFWTVCMQLWCNSFGSLLRTPGLFSHFWIMGTHPVFHWFPVNISVVGDYRLFFNLSAVHSRGMHLLLWNQLNWQRVQMVTFLYDNLFPGNVYTVESKCPKYIFQKTKLCDKFIVKLKLHYTDSKRINDLQFGEDFCFF